MAEKARARRKAERPGEILEAAYEEFSRNGYAATRLGDVAARAGVTKGTVYVYFENKEQVFASMVQEVLRPVEERVAAFLATSQGSGPDLVADLLRFLYAFIADDPRPREVIRLLIAEARRFPDLVDEHDARMIGPVVEHLRRSLGEARERGELRAMGVEDVPEVLISPAFALNVWMLLFSGRRSIDAERHREVAIDLMMRGLLPSGGSAR